MLDFTLAGLGPFQWQATFFLGDTNRRRDGAGDFLRMSLWAQHRPRERELAAREAHLTFAKLRVSAPGSGEIDEMRGLKCSFQWNSMLTSDKMNCIYIYICIFIKKKEATTTQRKPKKRFPPPPSA